MLIAAAGPQFHLAPLQRPGVGDVRRRIVAVVPAHNEESGIGTTLASLRGQTLVPDDIFVVCDNCTDDTAGVAARAGVVTLATSGNTAKKAGALNQGLARILPRLAPHDVVLVLDADTELDAGFLAAAVAHIDRRYAAVGGTFRGRGGGGFVGMLQRNEYTRYARDVARRHGRALVLTGTATLFTAAALGDVVQARYDGDLPGGDGIAVSDTAALTEDNELTLALLHRGWPIIAPPGCTMTTEVMTSWRELYHQRLRWKRGAVENIAAYGWTKVTYPYWLRQLWALIGLVVTAVYLTFLAYSMLSYGSVELHPVWLGVTAVFILERVVTVRARGLRQMFLSAILLVEMPYDLFLQGVHVKALTNAILNRKAAW